MPPRFYRVKDLPMPYAQTRAQALLVRKSGKVPSMTFLMSQWIPELAAAGVLEPLDKYFTKEELSVFPKGFIEDVSFKGKLYAVPTYTGPIVLYANKKLLKMAGYDPPRDPKDIEDLKEMIKKVSELPPDEKGNRRYGFSLRTSQDKNSAWWFVPWVWNYGGQLVDAKDNSTLDTPGFRKALEFYQWMGVNKYAPLGQTVHDTRNLFAQGNYGFVNDGPWLRGILRNISGQDKEKPKHPAKYIDNMYVTVRMPVGVTGERTGHANQTCQGVFSKAKNKDEIIKYLKWRSTDPWVSDQRFDMTGMMPASAKVLAQPKYQNDAVQETARFYAAHQPSNMVIGVATEYSAPNSIQVIRAINILRAIVGSIDVEGGDLISGPCPGFIPDVCMEANEMLSPEQRRKQLGSDRFRLFGYPGWELIEAQMRNGWGERHSAAVNLHSPAHAPTVFLAMITQKPYPVKSLLVSCSNPLLSYANTKLVYDALLSKDLLVTFDITWTPTAILSDYVLPAACWMERPDMGNFAAVGGYPLVQLGEAAVPARVPDEYERLNDYEFWRELGLRLGQADHWPWKTFEEVWEYRIEELMNKGGHTSLTDFVHNQRAVVVPPEAGKCKKGPLATPSGKVEIYSSIFEQLDYDPLPDYIEPDIPPEIKQKYPLINISGIRVMPYHHRGFRHVEAFRKRHRDPIVEIHFDTARKKGINDGDWVTIETPLGRIKQRARLSNCFHPRYIVSQHAWWFPELPGEEPSIYGLWDSNINVTTDDDPDKCDPMSGGWPLKGQQMRCKISKA